MKQRIQISEFYHSKLRQALYNQLFLKLGQSARYDVFTTREMRIYFEIELPLRNSLKDYSY